MPPSCRVYSFCIIVAIMNTLWTTLPHLLMLLEPHKESDNVTSSIPLSSLVHRPYPDEMRLLMKQETKRMFYWGYNHYLKHALPKDELDPIHCKGRGHDWNNPSNININDVLGDYSLTLIDTLDTLVVMGDAEGFKKAVSYIITHVSFNHCTTVQIFEATIRILGSLLSAHLIITDPSETLGNFTPEDYNNELLHLAHDLATRLLPAFDNTDTGLPHPRVNLCHGVPSDGMIETCTAGAGTLTIEFTLLSRLLGDPTYENLARKAVRVLWNHRHPRTGLVGNIINIQNGDWVSPMSGIGAGIDSFYEYLLKSFVLFGEREDLEMFTELYKSIMKYIRKGSYSCSEMLVKGVSIDHPLYVNVEYNNGKLLNYWFDSLSASFAGLQVLAGDLDEAICTHALYYTLWRKYDSLPERYDWRAQLPLVSFYPLRPELIESTYLLYQATHNPFYLHVGTDIFNSIERYSKAKCGYATIHDVVTKEQEDRMESFFLSETCKYLYLLFDTNHTLNKHSADYLFTTEGHILHINGSFQVDKTCSNLITIQGINETRVTCSLYNSIREYSLPLSRRHFSEIEHLIGLHNRL